LTEDQAWIVEMRRMVAIRPWNDDVVLDDGEVTFFAAPRKVK
jgi:hypothetical protein